MKSFIKALSSLFYTKKTRNLILFVVGFVATAWFLIRVIPKPSRATYPCQQAAYPFASAFVIWLSGIFASSYVFVNAKRKWRKARYILATILFFAAGAIFIATTTSIKNSTAVAKAYMLTSDLFGTSINQINYDLKLDSTVITPAAFVGAVKSEQANAADIDFDEIRDMLEVTIELAGGLDGIISNGDTVILKPNLVAGYDGTASGSQLQPEVNGMTTDHRVMQALVNIIRDLNPDGTIFIMEGSAAGSTENNMAILEYDQISGINGLLCLEDICGDWGDTNSVYLQGFSLPPEQVLYPAANNTYWVNKIYYNADVLISVPVLKNHYCTGTTGGIKNVGIGSTPATIYAVYPELLRIQIDHATAPLTNLHYFIHDYYMCRPVDFVVVDGLQGLQNGPASNSGIPNISMDQMNMRLIMASADPVAIDAVGSLLTGQDPEQITHLSTLHNDEMGCCDARLIRVNGIMVGDEKKAFDIWSFGASSTYSDFDPPAFSIDNSYIAGEQIFFSLSVDDEVSKVEVAVDGEYLDQIVIDSFEGFYIDLGDHVIGPGTEVTVYAYDRYLNYSSDNVLNFSIEDNSNQSAELSASLKVYPNPAGNEISVYIEGYDISEIAIYSSGGRKMLSKKPDGNKIDISSLPPGMYIVEVMVEGMKARQKVVVQ